MKILIIYRDFLLGGGVPSDARSFVSNFPDDVSVSVICKGKELNSYDFRGNIITIDSMREAVLRSFSQDYDYAVYIGFSSLYNVFLAKKINIPYLVLPFSQVNRFLDYDNPFFEKIIPDVKNLENSKFHYPKLSRVKNGNRDLFSYLRRLKRVVFRKTLGYFYLNNARAIGVFSEFEKDQIKNLYPYGKYEYFYYRFGLYREKLVLGPDEFDSEDKLRLVFWSRTDYYYKGIDRILNAIRYLVEEESYISFKLYIIGPDYNKGYDRISEFINSHRLNEHVELLKTGKYTSGTIGMLARADLSVSLSRWDGPPRVIRESLTLGVPVLASEEANFDIYHEHLDCGYLSKSQDDLVRILRNLNPSDLSLKKSNARKFGQHFEWNNVSSDFILQLRKLHRN